MMDLHVQVVGGFVHQQHVGPPQQHARQRDAHLPPAGERAHVAIDLVVLEAEAVQHLARLRFQRVAAEMLVRLLHLAEALQDAVHVAGAVGIFHGALQAFQLMVQVADAPAAGDGLVQHGAARHLFHVLAEIADGEFLGNRDVAFVGDFLAHHHAEEGGLAGAVGPDQSDLLARVQLKRSVNEDQLLAVLLVDTGKRNHRTSRLAGWVKKADWAADERR